MLYKVEQKNYTKNFMKVKELLKESKVLIKILEYQL